MADEIAINLTLAVNRGNTKIDFRPGAFAADMQSDGYSGGSIALNTSTYTLLPVDSGVAAGGWSYFRNVSTSTTTTPTLQIAVSGATNTPFATLQPSECAILRNSDKNFYARSVGSAGNIQFGVFSI